MKHVLFLSLFFTVGVHCSYNAQPMPNQALLGAFNHPHMRSNDTFKPLQVSSVDLDQQVYGSWTVTDTTQEFLQKQIDDEKKRARQAAYEVYESNRESEIERATLEYDHELSQIDSIARAGYASASVMAMPFVTHVGYNATRQAQQAAKDQRKLINEINRRRKDPNPLILQVINNRMLQVSEVTRKRDSKIKDIKEKYDLLVASLFN
jgi:hypothetical protein